MERKKRTRPAPICPFPDVAGYRVKPGEHSDLVAVIQIMLDNLAPLYDFPQVPLSGLMDGPTTAAVRRFQTVNGLPATGEVDVATWNRMAEEYGLACRCDER
ncbi:MAG: peptidoglycan-binding protein [Clostridia bacterium]|nr:peptidoglycan-binding protein [Clostridia bacterium]